MLELFGVEMVVEGKLNLFFVLDGTTVTRNSSFKKKKKMFGFSQKNFRLAIDVR